MSAIASRPAATLARAAAAFALSLGFWVAFARPYEDLLALAAERVLRATESPSVTRLEAREGEILVNRADFPPAAPRPGLPAADLHFNFVLLVALFALDRHPLRPERVAALLAAAVLLFLVHVAALVVQVRSVYAASLGGWSAARYGSFWRQLWTGAFHFYQIAGRFAAPFAIWWPFRTGRDEEGSPARSRTRRRAAG